MTKKLRGLITQVNREDKKPLFINGFVSPQARQ
jgi:hypothetical protein